MRTPVFEPQGSAGTRNLTFGAPGRGAPESSLLTTRSPSISHPALMADNAPPAPATDVDTGAMGLRALAPALRQVQWPRKFRPETPPCYDGATDPMIFLLAYEEAVLGAGATIG